MEPARRKVLTMTEDTRHDDLQQLVTQLVILPAGTEWVKFMADEASLSEIGKSVSALSNTAALHERPYGYLVWGIDDRMHKAAGTNLDWHGGSNGNEDIDAWLAQEIRPELDLGFFETMLENKRVVVLEVPAASKVPTRLGDLSYIRFGSDTRSLRAYPDREARLWSLLDDIPQEMRHAAEGLSEDEVTGLLDYPAYYRTLGLSIPWSRDKVMGDLARERFVKRNEAGGWDITILGALMLAVDLRRFGPLSRRGVRVIQYRGKGRMEGVQERSFPKGYIVSLEEVVQFVMAITPRREVLDGVFRRDVTDYPEAAIRELVSNLMVHQDLSQRGTSLMVEVFDGRIEFTNPGVSLIPTDRLLNAPPKTRNAEMVGIMRQMDLCEEGGTGWDIAVLECESVHLPAPRMDTDEETGTKVTVFFDRAYDRMTKAERRDATYWHACLLYAQGESMSNQTLRERFGLSSERKNVVAISRLIRECCDAGLLREKDEEASDKFRRYMPAWA